MQQAFPGRVECGCDAQLLLCGCRPIRRDVPLRTSSTILAQWLESGALSQATVRTPQAHARTCGLPLSLALTLTHSFTHTHTVLCTHAHSAACCGCAHPSVVPHLLVPAATHAADGRNHVPGVEHRAAVGARVVHCVGGAPLEWDHAQLLLDVCACIGAACVERVKRRRRRGLLSLYCAARGLPMFSFHVGL